MENIFSVLCQSSMVLHVFLGNAFLVPFSRDILEIDRFHFVHSFHVTCNKGAKILSVSSRDGISVNRYIGLADISAIFQILDIGIG